MKGNIHEAVLYAHKVLAHEIAADARSGNQIARDAGVPQAAISYISTGKRLVGQQTLDTLLAFYNLRLDYKLTRSGKTLELVGGVR